METLQWSDMAEELGLIIDASNCNRTGHFAKLVLGLLVIRSVRNVELLDIFLCAAENGILKTQK